jgi:hypothetical protein
MLDGLHQIMSEGLKAVLALLVGGTHLAIFTNETSELGLSPLQSRFCDHKISTGPSIIPVRHLRNSLKTQQKARLATTRTHKKRSNACTRDAILTAGKNYLLQRKRTTTKTEEESPERNTEDTITRERESGGLEIYTTVP